MNNVYTYSPLDRVIWDTPSLEAIEDEIKRLNAKKVFIVSSSTLSKKTNEIDKIIESLGKKFVGLFDNCIAHSPLENVIECANEVQKNAPDIIITIGGGTPIDTVKVVQLCYSLGINSVDELKKYLTNIKKLNQKLDKLLFQQLCLEENTLLLVGLWILKSNLRRGIRVTIYVLR